MQAYTFIGPFTSAAALAAALFATPASAGPRRADVFAPPAAVALAGAEKRPAAEAPSLNLLDPLADPVETPPIVAFLAAKPAIAPPGADDIDLGWALLTDRQRALALALDDWTAAPEAARDPQRRALRSKIAKSYVAGGFTPYWSDDAGWREGAASAAARLRLASEDGLDLHGLAIPAPEKDSADVARELALSEAVATYAHQARGGRLQPDRISRLIGAHPTLADPSRAVADVAAAGYRAGETLQGFNPPQYGYQQLREKLVELRARRAVLGDAQDRRDRFYGQDRFDSQERFAAADEIFAQTDAPPPAKARQRRPATPAATSRLESEIIANMERWRWLPRDMGEERIEVNIPDFELAVIRGGAVIHRTRVIVGKEETPTPIFSDQMVEIIVNPSWYVPQSIIQKEWHGGVGAGYQVTYRNGQMIVRQPPGEKNALGRIKFIFPNDFAVYMHDTPSRQLFSESHRAFSHGCMRVDEPFALAEAVLGPGSGWSEERVKRLIGPSERYINLPRPLPVHIEYFTAYVDESGRLAQRPDLYGYSARVRRALGLGG